MFVGGVFVKKGELGAIPFRQSQVSKTQLETLLCFKSETNKSNTNNWRRNRNNHRRV